MSEPIRILQVVTHMNRGGLETMIMNYYRKMDRNLVQFDFLTHRPEIDEKDYDQEILQLGGKIYHISKLNPFSISYKKELKDFFLNHPEYKIIHVHQDCMSGVILKVAKECDIPIRIAHCHSSSQDKDFKYLLKMIFKKNIPKYSTDLFACGEIAGQWMFGKARFEVLSNAINTRNYTFSQKKKNMVREKLGIHKDAFVLGHVGRFSEVKNHKFLLEVFEKIAEIDSDSILLLIGQGPTMEEMQRLVSMKQLNTNVKFLGLRSDVPDLLQAMDAFVLPSLYEGVPLSIIEAQAAGLHCYISERVPIDCKITELVHQINLQEDINIWAQEILSRRNYIRRDTFECIANAKYDITENAKFLQTFYLEKLC